MAENTAFRNNALPYPVYGVPWVVVVPILDADGDPVTGATALDSEISLNGDTIADAGTEAEIGGGLYSIALTGASLTADVVAGVLKTTTSGAKTTPFVLHPRKLVSLRAGTVGANAADGSTLQLDSGAAAVDDYYNGCLLVGVLDGTTECRVIMDYVGSTKVCSVTPNFTIAPDNNDTFTVYLPEGRQVGQADVVAWRGTAVPAEHTAGYPIVTVKDGTGTGEIDTASGRVAITEAQIDQIADEVWDEDIVAAHGTADTAGRALRTLDAISDRTNNANLNALLGVTDAAGADVPSQVTDEVWDEAQSGHVAAGTFGEIATEIADILVDTGTTLQGELDGIQTDTEDIQSRLPAALTGDGNIKADMLAVSGDAAAADNLESEYDGTGYGHVLQRTTIATLDTQTSFTLTAGSADNDAYNGCIIVVQDAATAAQKAVGVIADYVGATKTVTLLNDPAVFTIATTDIVTIIADRAVKPTVDNRTLDVTSGGAAGVDWANVENQGTTVGLSGTTVKTATDVETDTAEIGIAGAGLTNINLPDQTMNITGDITGNLSGSVGSVTGAVGSVAGNVGGNVVGSVGSVAAAGISAASIADGALTAAKFASGAFDAVWSVATRLLTAGTNIVLAKGVGVTGFNDLSAAQVNAEIVDALATDTYAEPGQGAPAATATIAAKINYLYKSWRNKKTQTSSAWNLFADDATTVDQKSTVSDDGTTATRGEIATGP